MGRNFFPPSWATLIVLQHPATFVALGLIAVAGYLVGRAHQRHKDRRGRS
jgi:hypothetical protein